MDTTKIGFRYIQQYEYRIYRIRYIKNLERNIAIGNLINNPYI